MAGDCTVVEAGAGLALAMGLGRRRGRSNYVDR